MLFPTVTLAKNRYDHSVGHLGNIYKNEDKPELFKLHEFNQLTLMQNTSLLWIVLKLTILAASVKNCEVPEQ